MSIKQKIGGGLAIGAMLASIVAPGAALAATNVNISGNGFLSKNGVAVVKANKSVVKQANLSKITTVISSTSNTGNNKSSFNVGGSNSITTGGATTIASVEVTGSSNTNSGGCGCPEGDIDVEISDNGAFSKNGVLVVDLNKSVVKQTNTSIITTVISSTSNTGGNSSSFNVSGGNTTTTGDTTTGIGVVVEGSTNENN